MVDKDNRCVYNRLEYIVTGKYAINKITNKKVFEIKPKNPCGFGDSLNLWVPIEDLYFIEEIVNEN